jgi:hypothetical protein
MRFLHVKGLYFFTALLSQSELSSQSVFFAGLVLLSSSLMVSGQGKGQLLMLLDFHFQ